ncbi:hypothetical protein BaRGS_00001431, partial [Batillaria attramentaria]
SVVHDAISGGNCVKLLVRLTFAHLPLDVLAKWLPEVLEGKQFGGEDSDMAKNAGIPRESYVIGILPVGNTYRRTSRMVLFATDWVWTSEAHYGGRRLSAVIALRIVEACPCRATCLSRTHSRILYAGKGAYFGGKDRGT